MKITIYELLGKVINHTEQDIYVEYFDRINQKKDKMLACKENIIYKLDQLVIELNDEVEIIEETKKIQELRIGLFANKQKVLANKINELVNEVNKLKEEGK